MKTSTLFLPAIAALLLGSCKRESFLSQRYTNFGHTNHPTEKTRYIASTGKPDGKRDPRPLVPSPYESACESAREVPAAPYQEANPFPVITASIPAPEIPVQAENNTSAMENKGSITFHHHAVQQLEKALYRQKENSRRHGLIFGVINLVLFIVIVAVIVALIIILVGILV